MTDAMESMSLDRIIELCKQIEQGYQSGKSGLDTGMVDQVLQLSDNAAALASALRELDEARGLLGRARSSWMPERNGAQALYTSYKQRRVKAAYRALTGVRGPRKTAEEYVMIAFLRAEGTSASPR